MKGWVKIVVVSLLLVGFAFGIGANALAQEKTYKVIVVVHGGISDPFWGKVENAAKQAGDLFPDLEVSYLGPTVYNFQEFMSYIDSAIASKPDALVCTLTTPEAMDESLRTAMDEGLPVIAINAPDLREPLSARIPVLTYIGEDSYFIGVTAAREALKRFKPKRAVYLNHHPGAAHIEARGRGWIDVMKEAGVPAEQLDITEDIATSAEVTAAYMKRNPDTDAIFCGNVDRTAAVIPRLEEDGIKIGTDVKWAQMDMNEQVFDYIKNDKIMFTMDQQPFLQGFLGVQLAYLYVKWGLTPPPAPVSTGPAVVTKENMADIVELERQGIR
jgi:simple sugar transport system substrate-binding protein